MNPKIKSIVRILIEAVGAVIILGIVDTMFFLNFGKDMSIGTIISNLGTFFKNGVLFYSVMIAVFVGIIELVRLGIKDRERAFFYGLGIVLLSALGIYFDFFIGKKYFMYTDIGSDTYSQYYTYFVNLVMNIKDSTFSTWNWDFGLGTSLLNMASWTGDPYAVLIIIAGLIFGAGSVAYLLVWMQLAKIITIYLLTVKYLGYHLKDKFAICITAAIIAVNGYLILWGQHFFLGTAVVFIMMVLCGIENFLKKECKKGMVPLALTVAFTMVYSYYIGFMVLLFGAVYFFYRYFTSKNAVTPDEKFHKLKADKKEKILEKIKKENRKNAVADILRCVLAVVSGILLSGVVSVSSGYYVLTNSSRITGESESVFHKMWKAFSGSFAIDDIGHRSSRLMSSSLLYINDTSNAYFYNYYEEPQLFCSIFMFFFIGLWFVYEAKKTMKTRKYFSFIVKLLLLYFLIFNSFSALVFYVFVAPVYRYTFLVVPILGLCIGISLEQIIIQKKVDLIGVILGAILSGATWYYSYHKSTPEVKTYDYVVGIFLLIGLIVLLLLKFFDKYKSVFFYSFVILTIITTILDGAIATNNRTVVTKDNFTFGFKDSKPDSDTVAAVEWIKSQDKSLFRLEKMYFEWCAHTDSMLERHSSVAWYNSTVNYKIEDFYQNIYLNSVAIAPSSAIRLFSLGSSLDQRALNLVNAKYLLAKESVDFAGWKQIKQIGSVIIYQNTETESALKWYSKEISKENFETLDTEVRATILADTVVTEDGSVLSKTGGDEKVSANPEDGGDETGSEATATVSDLLMVKPTLLKGHVKSTGKGILQIAIPDQLGWDVYVNGKKCETFNCDYGFLGVSLSEGEYDIELRYHIPMLGAGIICSVLGLIMIIGILYFAKIKMIFSKKNLEKKTEN